MNSQKKKMISGLSMLLIFLLMIPLFADKALSAINTFLLICVATTYSVRKLNEKNLTIKDLDVFVEEKITYHYENQNYLEYFLYKLVRPMVMVGLIFIAMLLLIFLLF